MKTSSPKKIAIVGGDNAAARARRLCGASEFIIFDRGSHISFANRVPYFVCGEIAKQASLLLQTPESLKARFNLDVRIKNEATSVDGAARQAASNLESVLS